MLIVAFCPTPEGNLWKLQNAAYFGHTNKDLQVRQSVFIVKEGKAERKVFLNLLGI